MRPTYLRKRHLWLILADQRLCAQARTWWSTRCTTAPSPPRCTRTGCTSVTASTATGAKCTPWPSGWTSRRGRSALWASPRPQDSTEWWRPGSTATGGCSHTCTAWSWSLWGTFSALRRKTWTLSTRRMSQRLRWNCSILSFVLRPMLSATSWIQTPWSLRGHHPPAAKCTHPPRRHLYTPSLWYHLHQHCCS